MTTTVQCPHCGVDHTNPCSPEQAVDCFIRKARLQAPTQQPGTMPDPTTTQPSPVPDLSAAIAEAVRANQPAPAPSQPVAPPLPPVSPVAAPEAPSFGAHNPEYYRRYKIQPIEYIRANELPFWAGNVVKYVSRQDAKNGIEDIEKSIDYLLKERAYLKGEQNWFLASLAVIEQGK